jgi:S-methylmethionine-dependent homocysteine/selenocysteine methylase
MSARAQLPQTEGGTYLTDGGIETVLIFHEGIDLPAFAAFPLVDDEQGRATLRGYFEPYLELARDHDAGFVLTSPTWRANPDWAAEVGYDREALAGVNRRSIALLEELRAAVPSSQPVLIEGLLGPRGDGYAPASLMTADEAERYHAVQLAALADTAADFVSAITMTYADEATGVVRAAAKAGLPVTIAFTLETDGRLPSGQPLHAAIAQVDAETDGACAYFGINCAHPTHFADVLDHGEIRDRVRSLRANASMLSHAELDAADDLDDGDPADLGARYAALRDRLPHLTVLGGCCGTDIRHVRAIADAWTAAEREPAQDR